MKINKKTWHYRLIKHTFYSVPNDLCQYVRRLSIAILLYVFLGFIAVVTSASLGSVAFIFINMVFGTTFFSALTQTTPGVFDFVLSTVIGATFLAVIGYIIYYSFVLYDAYKKKKADKQWKEMAELLESGKPKVQRPSLIKAWIKSKKEKMCTYIVFED